MASSFNHIVVTGNLTRDPETKDAGGTTITQAGIAINRFVKGNNEVFFLSLKAWGKTGEVLQQYAHKGSPVLASGRLECNKYTDRNGTERVDWGINVSEITLLGGKKDQASVAPTTSASSYSAPDF